MSYYNGGGQRRPEENNNPFGEPEREPTEQEKIISQILDVQQESKGSTQRSLALLHQTEEVGTATAEQLIEQGEKLDRIESTSKKIDSDLKESQKHINGLKSVFGGITNWWQSKKSKTPKIPEHVDEKPSGLRSVVQQSEPNSYHHSPAKSASRNGNMGNGYQSQPSSRLPTGGTTVQDVMEQHEQEIEDDLGEMGAITDRLKFMAMEFGAEIDKQSEQIDRINVGVVKTEGTMTGQNRQMNKI